MNLVVNNNNYSDIKTAVFYRSHKYIPNCEIDKNDLRGLIYQCTSDKILYQGNKTNLISKDFAEYDFSYLIEKYKFNDKMLLSLSDNYTKKLVGNKVDDIEKVEKTYFPTISPDDIRDNINFDYFGTTLINNQSFILFETPGSTVNSNGYYKIELYENPIISNNDMGNTFIESELLQKLDCKQTEFPVITIILGPESIVKNNNNSLYYSYDPQLINKNLNGVEYDKLSYRNLEEEIIMDNVVCLFLGNDNTVIDVNLSYKTWINNVNPNRNEKYFNLRNDDLYSTINNIKIVEKDKDTNFIIDKNSDTILANTEVKHSPILQNKLFKVNDEKYSPYVHYKKGQHVFLGNNPLTGERYIWESLIDNNYGENPYISSNWIEYTKINDFFTKRINVEVYPIEAGSITPDKNITIQSSDMKLTFVVNEELGYRLKDIPCYDENGFEIQNGVETKLVEVKPNYFIKEVTVSDWSPYIKSNLSKLIFKYDQVDSLISLYATNSPDILVAYQDWVDYFGDKNFRISNVDTIVEDNWESSTKSALPSIENGSDLQVSPKRKILITFKNLEKIEITSVTSIYYLNNKKFEKEIEISYNNDKKEVTIKDIVDFYKTKYIFNVTIKEYNIFMNSFKGFIVSEVSKSIKYKDSGKIMFYNIDSTKLFNHIKVINEEDKFITISSKEINIKKSLDNTNFSITKINNDNIYSINISNILSNFKIEII